MAGVVYEQRGTEIVRQGYLTKSPPLEKGAAFKKWQRRWIVLRSDEGTLNLRYYKTEAGLTGMPLGTIMMDNCTGIQRDMKHSHYKNIFAVNTPEREYFFAADSKHEMEEWVLSLTSTMGFAPGATRILPRKTSVPANINSSIQPAQMRRQGSLNLGVQASFSPVGSPPDVVTPTTPGYSYFSGQEAGRGTLARDRNTLPTECGAELSVLIEKRHAVGNIVYAEAIGSIWIVGWSKKDPYLHGHFQVGDQVLGINHTAIKALGEAQRAVDYCTSAVIEFVIKRTPYALEVQLQKRSVSEPLGLGLEKNKIIGVTTGGIASQCGLSGQAVGLHGKSVPWIVTAVNGRPIPITSISTDETMKRLHAAGLDVVLTLHPHDFVKILKKRLKSVKHWQDYLAK
eukprot:m.51514 g.51514  ORF g.51514 m.51514 type:complete len:398 (+) comp34155_c0_seq6:155-1348(+)